MTRQTAALATVTLAALVAVPACIVFTGPASDLDIEIVAIQTRPTPVGGATVSFTVTNVGEAGVWLARCGDRPSVAVDVRAGLGWSEY